MKKLRLISLACLAALLIVSAGGCAGTAAPTATPAPAAASATPQQTAAESAAAATAAPAEKVTLEFSAMLDNRGVDDSTSPAGKYWLEQMQKVSGMNVKVDWKYVASAEYDDKMKILLGSGDLPDYFLLPFIYDYTQMANEGFFLDLSKYNMVNYMKLVDQAKDGRQMAVMSSGMMPVLMQVILPITDTNRCPDFLTCPMYNYTAFQKEGIKVPETLDDVYTAAKAFKAKYPDSYPVNVEYNGVFAVMYAFHTYADMSGAGSIYWDGKAYTFAGLQPQYKEAVAYLHKLYAEKLFDPEYSIETPDTVKTKMLNEKNFMLLNSWRTQAADYSIGSGKTFVTAFIPDEPKYGKAWQTFGRANQVSLTNWTMFAINAKTKDPENLTKFIDMQYLPEAYEISSWGIPDVTYTVDASGNKKFVDEFFQAEDSSKIADKYGIWNDRSGRAFPGLKVLQDNLPRQASFATKDHTYFGGKYEDAPMLDSTYFKSLPWPNDYVPPTYNGPSIQLTDQENSDVSSILTQIQTFTAQEQAAFISGEKDMADFDASINTFKTSYDIQKVLDIYNAAAKRYFDKAGGQ